MRIVFFGTPLFAAHVLEYLLENGVNVVAVVSKPDRPKGRSLHLVATPVKQVALAHNPPLPVLQPEIVSDLAVADLLKSYQADLFVVVAYGEILRQHILEIPFKACLNLHTSLLPLYRGAAPIQRAIISGEKETGVTIMHMVKKMDAGDKIAEVVVPIGSEMTFGELEAALCDAGEELFLQVIKSFESGLPPVVEQDHAQATFAPKIELEDCEIDWSRPAQEIHNLVRGVNPYPGAWAFVLVKGEKKRLKVIRTRIASISKGSSAPGAIVNLSQSKGNLLVATGEGVLELLEVQLEGKKSMSSEELCRGISREYFSMCVTS